jgi:hypothetical protein
MSSARYKNEISLIIKEALNNYVTQNDKPEEANFIKWFCERMNYYQFRFTNTIVAKNFSDKRDVIIAVAEEIDKLQQQGAHKESEPEEPMKGEANEKGH